MGAFRHFIVFALLALVFSSAQAQEEWATKLEQAEEAAFKNNWKKALEYTEQAQQLAYRDFGNPSMQAYQVHGGLEFLYERLGHYTKAEALYLSDLAFLHTLPKNPEKAYASTATGLAQLYELTGKYREAEEIYLEVLPITERNYTRQNVMYSGLLRDYGNILHRLGQYDKAEATYLEVLQLEETTLGKGHQQYAITLNNIAMVLRKKGDFPAAKKYLRQAMGIAATTYGDNSAFYAGFLNNMGDLHYDLEETDSAETNFREALSIYRKTKGTEHPDYANAQVGLANLYRDRKLYGEAAELYAKALATYEAGMGRNSPFYIHTLYEQSLLLERMDAPEKAEQSWAALMDLLYDRLDRIFPALSESERSSFYNTAMAYFGGYRRFCMERSAANPAMAAQLYNHLLATKGILLDAQEKIRRQVYSGSDPGLKTLYEEWQAAVNLLARGQQLAAEEKTKQGISTADIEKKITSLEKELSKRSALFASEMAVLDARAALTWEQVRDQLAPGEVAMELMRLADGTDTVYVALSVGNATTGHPGMIVLKEGALAETTWYRHYSNAIRFQVEDTESYERFWKPLEAAVGTAAVAAADRIYLSADGVYNKLNPATLYNTDKQAFLADGLTIVPVHSTRDVATRRQAPPTATKNVVLLGYPDYYPERAAADDAASGLQKKAFYRGLETGEIVALPGTREEINAIETLLGAEKVAVAKYLGAEAAEPVLKNVAFPRILHIATHGYFIADDTQAPAGATRFAGFSEKPLAENPLFRSGLLLTGAGTAVEGGVLPGAEDGILTAYEAMTLDLEGTELVVLSACETGLGDIRNGEGVYGLQRAFQVAGARAVVMSLWKVNDEATRELMVAFYTEFLLSGNRQVAFGKAMVQLRSKYPNPYYWGAFLMIE